MNADKIVEYGLVACFCGATLAFGGMHWLYFSIVQSVLLALGAVVIISRWPQIGREWKFAYLIPVLLLCYVGLQVLPLPFPWVRNGLVQSSVAENALRRISVSPHDTLTHLLRWTAYFAGFYAVLTVGRLESARKRFVLAILLLASFEAFYGLIQYLLGWQQIFSYVKVYNLNEATGTYINRNHYAGLLEMALPFAVGLAFQAVLDFRLRLEPRSGAKRRLIGGSSLQRLLFWGFLASVFLVAIVFSRSRMGLIAALLSVLIMGIVFLLANRDPKLVAVVICVALLFAAFLASYIGLDPVAERFSGLAGDADTSRVARLTMWSNTLKLIGEHFWVGTGLGTFPIVYTQKQVENLNFLVNHAHNDYLELALELGVPAAAFLFGTLFMLWVKLLGRARSFIGRREFPLLFGLLGALSAILLHSLTDFNLYIPANALLFSLLAGLACAFLREREESGAVREDMQEV